MLNINNELKEAVYNGNLGEVKALLLAGARINDNYTLLHHARTVEITRELLSYGANVYARNTYRETPLIVAIKDGKESGIVRELLKHGADVNATDRHGNTPLNLAVKKRDRNLDVIKELLKYGADINIRNKQIRLSENHNSSLDNAVYNVPCAKLLIKFALINNFNEDYTKFIDLKPYESLPSYNELSSYLDDCVCEILQMKTNMIKDNLSLYAIIVNRYASCNNKLSLRLSNIDFSVHYPIYNDIISDKIKPFLEKASLLNKLNELQVCTESDTSNQSVKVILDPDSKYNIAEYLCNDDLLNLIMAFCDSNKYSKPSSDSVNSLIELSKEQPGTLHEDSTSNCTKRARLE